MSATWSIVEFGATPNDSAPATAAIQKAVDACHQAGGGTVFCPAGAFQTGTIHLKSRVTLRLDSGCRLLGTTNLADYPDLSAPGFIADRAPEKSAKALVMASGAEQIAITGAGEINGMGPAFYEQAESGKKFDKPLLPRPRIVMFYQCRGIRIEGVSFVDSACWTLWLMQCQDVAIHRIRASGDRRMRNIDGVDIDACRNVVISDCAFETEDDCIVLRAIQGVFESPAVCENIVVNNCILDSACQGVRIGCPCDGVIRNAVFSNLIIKSEYNGIASEHPRRYWREGVAAADISNISFTNAHITCKRTPILLNIEEGIRLSRLEDFMFANIRILSGLPCLISGSDQTAIENIRFSNMRVSTTGEDALLLRRCRGILLSNVEIENRNKE